MLMCDHSNENSKAVRIVDEKHTNSIECIE